MHRMELDLTVGDDPSEHFYGGLVRGGDDFPHIDTAVALHGFFCWDSAFTI